LPALHVVLVLTDPLTFSTGPHTGVPTGKSGISIESESAAGDGSICAAWDERANKAITPIITTKTNFPFIIILQNAVGFQMSAANQFIFG
jgi:hypothetical protein